MFDQEIKFLKHCKIKEKYKTLKQHRDLSKYLPYPYQIILNTPYEYVSFYCASPIFIKNRMKKKKRDKLMQVRFTVMGECIVFFFICNL